MTARSPWLDPTQAPEAPALRQDGRTQSRAELAARADALAAWLGGRGIGPGDIVAAHLPNGIAFATLLHAADRRDAILLPLHRRHTESELAHVLGDAAPRLVLHAGDRSASVVIRASETAGTPDCAFPDTDNNAPSASPRLGYETPALLLYTSGTTGTPKGAVLTHANLRAAVEASAAHLGARDDDRWLACLPFYHVGGLSILLRAASQAVPCEIQEGFDAVRTNRALDSHGITHVSLVPTLLARLLEARGERRGPDALRIALIGGASAPPALLERAVKLGWPVAPTYGLTEAAAQVATRLPDADPEAGAAPLPGVSIRVVDERGQSVAPGTAGEIWVRGNTVTAGYWRRPEETARVLAGGWLRTGDIGALDARGRLRVFDRRADLVVSGGENVYPAQVEAVLLEHPNVAEAGVAGVPDKEYGNRPVAWVVSRGKQPLDAERLARFCRDRLAGYEVPVRFHRMDSLPRTASGKLQRRRLVEPSEDSWN